MRSIDIELAIRSLEQKAPDYDIPIIDLIEAQTREPWKVLVGTILSARTSDKTTAGAVNRLFGRISGIRELSNLSLREIESLIYPVGFYRNKARFLKALPGVLETDFGGEIPSRVEELVRLPGVGRKTANLVSAVGFGLDAICVDTHVHRIMNIWGYVTTATPFETEMALRRKLPRKYWRRVNTLLVAHGQAVCRPVGPHCDVCVLSGHCPRRGVVPRRHQRKTDLGNRNKDRMETMEKKLEEIFQRIPSISVDKRDGKPVLVHRRKSRFVMKDARTLVQRLENAGIPLEGGIGFDSQTPICSRSRAYLKEKGLWVMPPSIVDRRS